MSANRALMSIREPISFQGDDSLQTYIVGTDHYWIGDLSDGLDAYRSAPP